MRIPRFAKVLVAFNRIYCLILQSSRIVLGKSFGSINPGDRTHFNLRLAESTAISTKSHLWCREIIINLF